MEFTDLQTILTVMVVLTAAAVVVFFDCRRKQRAQQPQRINAGNAEPSQRSSMLFSSAPPQYEPAKKLATERPLEPLVEPLVATATVSKPPAAPHPIERETVTIQMMDPGTQMTGPGTQMTGPGSVSPSQELALPTFSGGLPAFTIDAALWERLMADMPQNALLTSGNEESNPEPAPRKPVRAIDVAPGALDANYQVLKADEPQTIWPKGMIQQPAFQKLLDGGEPFSGLVVSIGVNESDSSMWHSQGLMQSVGSYIGGLLREKDFSCRTAYDEFIMVCCGEHGAQSQRRLNHISERLWDYQLRGIGTCAILFSWGGVEVQDQPLAEAVSSAVDRMRQTKRAGSPSGSGSAHRKAV